MKTTRKFTLLCLAGFILASFTVKGQADSFDSDIMKMQQVNGSNASTNALFPRIMAQIRQSKPDLTDARIAAMKIDVFDVEVASLNEQQPTFMAGLGLLFVPAENQPSHQCRKKR